MGFQKIYTLWGLSTAPEAVALDKNFRVAFLEFGRVVNGVDPKPLGTGSNPDGEK